MQSNKLTNCFNFISILFKNWNKKTKVGNKVFSNFAGIINAAL